MAYIINNNALLAEHVNQSAPLMPLAKEIYTK